MLLNKKNLILIELLKKNMNINDLAKKINVHITYIYKIINQERKAKKKRKEIVRILELPDDFWE